MSSLYNDNSNDGGFNEFFFPSEKEKESFSIPKILVAVLLFMLVAVVAFHLLIGSKQKSSLNYLQESNKQTERELRTMTEKYNLSNDDNTRLEKKITEIKIDTKHLKDSIANENKRIKDSILSSK